MRKRLPASGLVAITFLATATTLVGSTVAFDFGSSTSVMPNERVQGAFFGGAVAAADDILIVGARGENSSKGAAYLFHRSGSAWSQVARFEGDLSRTSNYGIAVAASGETVVVGANHEKVGNRVIAGAVYVYRRVGGAWQLEQKLTSASRRSGARFGTSVAIDGDTLVVGAMTSSAAGGSSGEAHVFVRESSTWTEVQQLLGDDTAGGDAFGRSVAIDGKFVAVGASLAVGDLVRSGAVYVFKRVKDRGRAGGRAAFKWKQQAKLSGSQAGADDLFAESVAVDGRTLAVGARKQGQIGQLGSAYVFTRKGKQWTEQARVTGDGSFTRGDYFGLSVGLSGGIMVVGAPWDDSAGERNGVAYVFRQQGTAWPRTDKLVGSPIPVGEFGGRVVGWSVTANSGRVYVGAPGGGLDPTNSGAVAAYQ